MLSQVFCPAPFIKFHPRSMFWTTYVCQIQLVKGYIYFSSLIFICWHLKYRFVSFQVCRHPSHTFQHQPGPFWPSWPGWELPLLSILDLTFSSSFFGSLNIGSAEPNFNLTGQLSIYILQGQLPGSSSRPPFSHLNIWAAAARESQASEILSILRSYLTHGCLQWKVLYRQPRPPLCLLFARLYSSRTRAKFEGALQLHISETIPLCRCTTRSWPATI